MHGLASTVNHRETIEVFYRAAHLTSAIFTTAVFVIFFSFFFTFFVCLFAKPPRIYCGDSAIPAG